MKSERFGIAPHKEDDAVDTLTEKEDIIKLARPGDYYQIMKNIGGGGGHSLKITGFRLKISYKPYFKQSECSNVVMQRVPKTRLFETCPIPNLTLQRELRPCLNPTLIPKGYPTGFVGIKNGNFGQKIYLFSQKLSKKLEKI